MGAGPSHGVDNESLIDNLVESGYTLPPEVERALRLVDRGSYFEEKSDRAYLDSAWRSGSIHLSAPSIYMTVLSNLDLKPGLHFLNVGSGSGYLSTIIGLILGYRGVNHGIELNSSTVEFAKARLIRFLTESDAPFERDFCIPQFIQGNIFDLVVPTGNGHAFTSFRPAQASGERSANSAFQSGDQEHHDEQVRSMNLSSEADRAEQDREAQSDLQPDNDPVARINVSNLVRAVLADRSDSSSDEDIGPPIRPGDSTDNIWLCPVDPPPLVKTDNTDRLADRPDFVHWPQYDRIYVGAAVQSLAQLRAILRLLKIDGMMIAPVRDKLVKVTRHSEETFHWMNILSVSFATLVVPEADLVTSFDPPPPMQIPTLEQLTTRVLRSLLRSVVLQRHDGKLPTIGRLEEIDSITQPRKRQNRTRPEPSAGVERNTIDTEPVTEEPCCSLETSQDQCGSTQPDKFGSDHDDEEGSTPDEADGTETAEEEDEGEEEDGATCSHDQNELPRPRSPSNRDSATLVLPRRSMARLFHHMMLRSRIIHPSRSNPSEGRNESDDITHSNDSVSDSSESRNSSTYLYRLFVGAEPPETQSTASSGDSNQTEQSTDQTIQQTLGLVCSTSYHTEPAHSTNERARRRKTRQPKLRYKPPSYKIKEEIHQILCNDLDLSPHCVYWILTL